MLLLSARAVKWCRANEWLTRISPAVGMRVVRIVVFEIGCQAPLEFFRGRELAACQESTLQHTKPQFDLIQPGTMFGGEVEYVFVRSVRQKRTAIDSSLQRLRAC